MHVINYFCSRNARALKEGVLLFCMCGSAEANPFRVYVSDFNMYACCAARSVPCYEFAANILKGCTNLSARFSINFIAQKRKKNFRPVSPSKRDRLCIHSAFCKYNGGILYMARVYSGICWCWGENTTLDERIVSTATSVDSAWFWLLARSKQRAYA